MASHFVLFPLMAQGHTIPMIDFAKLLAQRGLIITIITTPHNQSRFQNILARAINSGSQIQTAHLQFPFQEAGLPENCDNLDLLPSLGMATAFFHATFLLRQATENLFEQLLPRPSCIISDVLFPWTVEIAHKFQIPRITFYSLSCFYLFAKLSLLADKTLDGFPELTKLQLNVIPGSGPAVLGYEILKADLASHGVIVNTFEEMEPEYVRGYKKARGTDKVWCIGSVSLCNKDTKDMAERGDNAAIDELECVKWLDGHEPRSVVYAALGSLCNVVAAQIVELGLALEESNRPFIWVIRREDKLLEELEKWVLEYGFEEKTKGRGLLIRGWAPQVLVLSHPAVGGFITHCGWNSTVEAIAAGVPMVCWPLFGDQFFNEKLVVKVLRVGVSVGVEESVMWGDEERVGVLVKKEAIGDAVRSLMDGEEREEMRERVRKLAEMAKRAVEEDGSSHLNTTQFIEDIVQMCSNQFQIYSLLG